jgi:hypothetical protein
VQYKKTSVRITTQNNNNTDSPVAGGSGHFIVKEVKGGVLSFSAENSPRFLPVIPAIKAIRKPIINQLKSINPINHGNLHQKHEPA